MPRETKREHEQDMTGAGDDPTMVAAMFAGTLNEAERCCELLREHGIPAMVGDEADGPRSRAVGIPLLVPEPMLDNAAEILAARPENDDDSDGAIGASDADEDFDEDGDDDDDYDDEFGADDEESWDEDDDDDDEFDDDEDFE